MSKKVTKTPEKYSPSKIPSRIEKQGLAPQPENKIPTPPPSKKEE